MSPYPVYVQLSATFRCAPRQLSEAEHPWLTVFIKRITLRRTLVVTEKSHCVCKVLPVATHPDDFPYLSSSNSQYVLPSSPSADDLASVHHYENTRNERTSSSYSPLPTPGICAVYSAFLFVYKTETFITFSDHSLHLGTKIHFHLVTLTHHSSACLLSLLS